jgi:hypothetical protein
MSLEFLAQNILHHLRATVAVQWLVLPLRVQEIVHLNLGPATNSLKCGFSYFSTVPQEKG